MRVPIANIITNNIGYTYTIDLAKILIFHLYCLPKRVIGTTQMSKRKGKSRAMNHDQSHNDHDDSNDDDSNDDNDNLGIVMEVANLTKIEVIQLDEESRELLMDEDQTHHLSLTPFFSLPPTPPTFPPQHVLHLKHR